MFKLFMDFMGFSDYVLTDELLDSVLPVLIVVAAGLTFFLFLLFFNFLLRILRK